MISLNMHKYFFMGGDEQEAIHRCQLNNGVNNNIIVQIQEALHKLPGEINTFKSINTVPDPEESVNFSTEFLNSLQPAGLPPHHLHQSYFYEIYILLDFAMALD